MAAQPATPNFDLCGTGYTDQAAAQAAAHAKPAARGGRWKAKRCALTGGHWHVYLVRQDRNRRDKKHGRIYA